MTYESFEEWKEKLFHTKLLFIDKAFEKAKAGHMESFENQYVNEIDQTVS